MLYRIKETKRFLKKAAKYKKAGQPDLKNLYVIIPLLREGLPLPAKFEFHKLSKTPDFPNDYECHVCPNLCLVIQYDGDVIYLKDLDSHANLFKM